MHLDFSLGREKKSERERGEEKRPLSFAQITPNYFLLKDTDTHTEPIVNLLQIEERKKSPQQIIIIIQLILKEKKKEN